MNAQPNTRMDSPSQETVGGFCVSNLSAAQADAQRLADETDGIVAIVERQTERRIHFVVRPVTAAAIDDVIEFVTPRKGQ